MTISAILLRFNKGHRYLGEPGDGERFIRIDTDSEALATGLAEEYLTLHATDSRVLSVAGRVLDGSQIPGHAYAPGDHMSSRLIQSTPVSLGPEAEADVALELGGRLDQRENSLERRIERASRGVATRSATPQINVEPVEKGNDKTPPPYSLGQVLYPSRSPAWSVSSPFWVAFMEVTLETPGEEASLIRMWHNAEMIAECWIEAGSYRNVVKVTPWTNGRGFRPQDFMIMEVKVAGTDAANLAVVLRGAMTGD